MEVLRETTGGLFPAHTYLLDGTTLVAYIKVNDTKPFYFKSGIKGFDRRGRKFETLKTNPFKEQKDDHRIAVLGSKGNTYYVSRADNTCTCPGYTYRGACKHVAEHGAGAV